MILYSKVTEVPEAEPVTVAEAKTHLEVTGTAKDTYIASLIKTARRICEADAGLSFITQTRVVKLDRFPSCWPWPYRYGVHANTNPYSEIILPYGPVTEVTDFSYFDSDGNAQSLTVDTDFYFDGHSPVARLRPVNSWPSTKLMPNAVSIEYSAGIDLNADTSEEYLPIVKQAILLQVGSMFENRQDESIDRGSAVEINWNSRALLDSIRVTWNANYD